MEIETFEIHVILCVGDRFSWMNVYRNFLIIFFKYLEITGV